MKELLEKPYYLRQFIVVERDEVILAKAKRQEELENEEKKNLSIESTEENKKVSIRKAAEVAGNVGNFIADIVNKSLEKQRELSNNIFVNYLSFTQTSDLKFPIGHPRENELYVSHPTLEGTYYPINEFHKKSFEHKFSELNALLMDLGAKKVSVEHVSGWDFNSVKELDTSEKNKVSSSKSNSNEKKILYYAEYNDNNSFELPSNMAWYYHEPTWQSVGDGRLNHDLQNFNLTLEYNDDFGINLDLYAKISKIGFGVKKDFQKQESTVWKIFGEF